MALLICMTAGEMNAGAEQGATGAQKKYAGAKQGAAGATLTDAAAQEAPESVYCVTACPSEDISRSMNISWAADTTVRDSYVLFTEKSDRKWRKARKVMPGQKELCTVFDSIYSRNPAGEDIYEDARFIKCGASISGLRPDTEYKYIICRIARGGGERVRRRHSALCGEHRFKTAGDEEWSCCIISDFHSYTPLARRLDSGMNMLETVKKYDPEMDWVLHAGDVCAWGGSYSFWKALYEREQFSDFFWAGVNGNHDNMSRKYELTNEYFKNASYYPRNGYEGQMGVCYHFRYSDALFIMLNSESMRDENGLLAAQNWVRKVVQEQNSSSTPPRYVIVVEHYQWFLGDSGRDFQYGRWCGVFDELGVDLAVSGNDHVYCRTGSIYAGAKTDGAKGTVYLTTSSSDNERGRTMSELSDHQEFIEHRFTEGPKTVSALSMKVSPEKIVLTLIDRTGKIMDQATIQAKR